MSRGSVVIGIYTPRIRERRVCPRIVVVAIGALLSIGLHALIFVGIIWGERTSASHPPNAIADTDYSIQHEEHMEWIALDAPADITAQKSAPPIVDASMLKIAPDTLAQLTAVPEPYTQALDPESRAPDDSTSDSALYGRYMGQINAHAFRAWLRPRTPIGSSLFSCRAQIDQDAHGRVTEVTLQDCNGDSRWQLSVVRAIQMASPLPAPPDPKVFRQRIFVTFQSGEYRPGMPGDEFEP